jgi:hypothetical protein
MRRAFGRSVPFAKAGFVYLTGSAIGSIIPTPGGLGAVKAALTMHRQRQPGMRASAAGRAMSCWPHSYSAQDYA